MAKLKRERAKKSTKESERWQVRKDKWEKSRKDRREKTKEKGQRREVKLAIWCHLCALPPHITGQRLMNEWKSIPIIELTRAVGMITVKWRGCVGQLKREGQGFDSALDSFASSAKTFRRKGAKDKAAVIYTITQFQTVHAFTSMSQTCSNSNSKSSVTHQHFIPNDCRGKFLRPNKLKPLRKESVHRSLCLQPSITNFEYKPLLTAVSSDNKAGHIFAYHRAGWS